MRQEHTKDSQQAIHYETTLIHMTFASNPSFLHEGECFAPHLCLPLGRVLQVSENLSQCKTKIIDETNETRRLHFEGGL